MFSFFKMSLLPFARSWSPYLIYLVNIYQLDFNLYDKRETLCSKIIIIYVAIVSISQASFESDDLFAVICDIATNFCTC